MGRRAKQRDPLKPRASRVEKKRLTTQDLPDWLFRVENIRMRQDRYSCKDPADFNEDLSELEEEDPESGSESQDDYDSGNDTDSEDTESKSSYDGSAAYEYYKLKRERTQRKREKLKEQMQERESKARRLEIERRGEEEVHAVERCLKEAQKRGRDIYVNPLAGQAFDIYCSAHVDNFYCRGFYGAKYVEFIHPDDMRADDDSKSNDSGSNDSDEKSASDDAGMLYELLYLGGYTACEFGPFTPPDIGSVVRPVKMKSCEGKYTLSLYCLGGEYLKLRVSRNMVFHNWDCDESPAACPPDTSVPKVFEFGGIWRRPDGKEHS